MTRDSNRLAREGRDCATLDMSFPRSPPDLPPCAPRAPDRGPVMPRPFLAVPLLAALSLPSWADDRPAPPAPSDGHRLETVPVPAPVTPVAAALQDLSSSWLFKKTDAGLQVVDLASGEEVFA